MNTTIGVIGKGFVGTALIEGMRHAFTILGYDAKQGTFVADQNGVQNFTRNSGWEVNPTNHPIKWLVSTCPTIFVCVPTPMKQDGCCDVSIVESVIKNIYDEAKLLTMSPVVIIKSTVVPGTTQKLNDKYSPTIQCVFNPEFLREATYIEDFKNQDRIIIGGPRPASSKVREMYQHAYPDVPTVKTCSTTAEMVKYITNCFLAVKVSFANEIKQIADKLGVDFDKIVEYATKDPRLGTSHWSVPGPMQADDGSGRLLKGFGGSCFIKDLNALMCLAKEMGIDPKVMSGAWEKNLECRPEKDWLNLKGRAVN